MSNDVPLLTAEMAVLLRTYDPSVARPQLLAIADGRAIVVPRMSEAEARERWLRQQVPTLHRHLSLAQTEQHFQGYLAALRDLGVIRD